MACCTLKQIVRDCSSNIGGIRKAWIANYDQIKTITDNKEEITDIQPYEEGTMEWVEFEFRKQTGSVTTTITKDDATGTLYYESAIVLQFTKQESSKRKSISRLATNDIAVVIQDNNGEYWYFGKDFPVSLTEGSAETGTAFADLNGYNITLTDLSKELPYALSSSAINVIKGIQKDED